MPKLKLSNVDSLLLAMVEERLKALDRVIQEKEREKEALLGSALKAIGETHQQVFAGEVKVEHDENRRPVALVWEKKPEELKK